RTLPAHSRCFLIRQSDASVVVRLDLSGSPEVLTVLSGRESTVRKLDALRERYGDAPRAWYPALTGQAWPGDGDTAGADEALWIEAAE
ncbi:VirB4 family type IV secretion/conjugal transfer ATPase, partial [Novosphingobium sp. 2637]|nr:VirB4 family type IV secretion/conjugal transfer ATPase [Novosphingobium mangrovi (ex Hu et al. 2023)]